MATALDETERAIESSDDITELTELSPQKHANSEKPSTSCSNVYSPLITGARLLTSASANVQPSTDVEKTGQVKKVLPKPNLAVVSTGRGQRSLVRPFFCCGSELSLVSLVDGLELKDGPGQVTAKLKSIECTDSSSEEEESSESSSQSLKSQSSSLSTSRSVVRRKKKDKHSSKKKSWSLRLRGRWNTRWRVSQPQRSSSHRSDLSHHASGGMSTGSYHGTGSPGPWRRISRARSAFSSSQLVSLQQVINFPPTEDVTTLRQRERAEEMARGVEIPSDILNRALRSNIGFSNSMLDLIHQRRRLESYSSESNMSALDYSLLMNNLMQQLQGSRQGSAEGSKPGSPRIYTQVDFIHCLVPHLVKIMSCPFYWGVMDRYEAERLLDSKPEGTFLLRDSAQEDFLFSVSFRRYNRCLHARVEQWNHRFSFDAHDPCVYSAPSVCELMEHYKDPSRCMFFEPMLARPLPRNFTFSLQHICRAVICDTLVYDQIHELPIPNSLKQYLQMYHYKQKVRVRHFDGSGLVYADNQVLLD